MQLKTFHPLQQSEAGLSAASALGSFSLESGECDGGSIVCQDRPSDDKQRYLSRKSLDSAFSSVAVAIT